MSESQAALADAFGFTADDLETNRSGHVSASQRAQLDHYDKRSSKWSIIAVGVMVVWASFLFVLVGQRSAAASIAIAIVIGVSVLAVVIAAAVGRRRFGDVRAGRVSTAEGAATPTATVTTSELGMHEMFTVRIGDEDLRIASQLQHDAFERGREYRVYYVRVPGAPVVLSAEPVDGLSTGFSTTS